MRCTAVLQKILFLPTRPATHLPDAMQVLRGNCLKRIARKSVFLLDEVRGRVLRQAQHTCFGLVFVMEAVVR